MKWNELFKNARVLISSGTVCAVASYALLTSGFALYAGQWSAPVVVQAALAAVVLWQVYPLFKSCFEWFLLKWPNGWLPSVQQIAMKHDTKVAASAILAAALLVSSCAPVTTPRTVQGQPVVQQSALPVVEAGGNCGMHVVQAGENLFRIGLHYGVDHTTLAQQNGITNVRTLQVGSTLVIPCGR